MQAINERRDLEDSRQRAYVEWQTRVLGHLLVSTNPYIGDRGRDSLHEVIDTLSILPSEEEPEVEYRMVRGEKVPVRYNSTEGVMASLAPGVVRERD